MADWYPIFWNPPTYGEQVYCNAEVVYPRCASLQTPLFSTFCDSCALRRWSIVLLFLLFSAGLVLVVRLPISTLLADRKGTPSIFGALYYLPLYAIANAVGAGLFCTRARRRRACSAHPPLPRADYAFPYILMTFVLLFNVFHLSRKSQGVFRSSRNIALFAARYALLSFCVAAIMLQFPTARANITPLAIGLTAVLSPAVPSLVYFLTSRCTDPEYW